MIILNTTDCNKSFGWVDHNVKTLNNLHVNLVKAHGCSQIKPGLNKSNIML